MTPSSLMFLLYADIARCNSAAAALLMNVDSSSSAGSHRQMKECLEILFLLVYFCSEAKRETLVIMTEKALECYIFMWPLLLMCFNLSVVVIVGYFCYLCQMFILF